MAVEEGLTLVEAHVLQESDGHAQLWELAASWTENGDERARIDAVPLLSGAVTSLARRGFVEVFDFQAWPLDWDSRVPVSQDDVSSLIDDPGKWLWRGDVTCLITVSLTEAGVPWL